MSVLRSPVVATLVFMLAVPAVAADPGVETRTVRVPRPATVSPGADRRLDRRIAAAALEACGASPYSAAEVKAAIARSTCWQQAYAGGIAQARGDAADLASLPPSRITAKP